MGPPGAAFNWRDRVGIILAIAAGLLLFIVGLRIYSVGHETGGDISVLTHEQSAVDFLKKFQAFNAAFQEYRMAVVLHGPRSAEPLGKRADAALATIVRFDKAIGNSFDIATEWKSTRSAWIIYRAHPDIDNNAFLVGRRLIATIDQLEETSNLIYDPNISAQNLADVVFAELPRLYENVDHSAVVAERFVQQKQMTLAARISLAVTARGLSSPVKTSIDDLKLTRQNEQKQGGPAAGDNIAQINAMLARTPPWTRYADFEEKYVAVVATPAQLSIPQIERFRVPATAATLAVRGGTTQLLSDNIARRIEMERTRRLLYQIGTVLAALLLVGIMLEIVRFVARRDREELHRVQEESARLYAELAREHAEKALALTEAQFRAVFDGAAIGIAILDRSGSVVDANSVFREHFGRESSEFLDGHQEELESILTGRRKLFEFEQHYAPADGSELWIDATVSVVSDEKDAPQFAMCMFRDITEVKRNERRMVHDMTHDTLTGLPNRLLFETQLRDRFAESSTLLDSFFAVLFIDLDHFKDFNESLGHGAGDMVLQSVATRLRASLDPNDLVARLGSDEFAVLIRSLGDILHVESVARRIINNVCKPIQVGDRAVFAACSIGIAIGSATYERAEDVMRDANTAMSQAKSSGGSRYAVFDSNMHARAERRLQLTTDLRLAIARNEFRLLYQPIVQISDGVLAGCEALLRWDHPTEGLILPGDFMSLAEQTGIAIPIGKFVFETAVKQLSKWRQNWSGAAMPPFSMSINVSASEIFDADFEAFVVATCDNHGVDPREVTLEITESVVLDSNTRANLLFERLQKQGFKICIDDFGTGYSSLRYLQQFRIDQLKIDRSFVAAPDGEIASEPIVRTLMTLAEAFDLRVVAEGVESQRQRDMLRQAGCRFAQGYFYSRAISAPELATMYPQVLARSNTPASA
jgi:diguanylate cyclase (GGDEF)-like protein/PAS domain S-box-containing protein